MWLLLLYICSFISGSCLESPGSVAGGGAIELVAEKGKIVISKELMYFKFTQTNILIVQGNCGSTSNKLQQNLFYRAIDKVDELNNILKVPKNPIGGTC